MSITGSNNPFACEPVVFANANSIVSLGTITRDGNQFTFSVGFVWKINGVTYQNTAPVVITIAEASTGFKRIDNALLNTSNTIELQQGLESDTIALQPIAPPTAIILTSFDIDGDVIDEPEVPVTGSQFKQKNESRKFSAVLSGTDQVIEFRTAGHQHYEISGTVTSVAGFGKTLLLASPSAEIPYAGKDIFFENNSGHDITLKDNFSGVDIKFDLGTDLVVPANGIVWLKYDATAETLALFFKSWSDGGKRTQSLMFQVPGATTLAATQVNYCQSRFNSQSVFGTLGLVFSAGVTETSGVLNLVDLSDKATPEITPNYISKVKHIKFSYSRNVAESGANTNLMIRLMGETKYSVDMQLIAEYNLTSSSATATSENKVDIPILTHLPLSAYSNLKWCIRVNNATAQTFNFIRLNIDIEEV